jgi:crotonobetainyl-CoA:carnitine CoA-transferase CaiB-like acyl-CoA transferase
VGESGGILKGLRVVEAATFVLGPAAGTVMADYGADVVKVEPCVVWTIRNGKIVRVAWYGSVDEALEARRSARVGDVAGERRAPSPG